MSRTGHPLFARFYAWAGPRMEPALGTHRRALLDGLSGRVIEVGAGSGLNFPHYRPGVTGVLAVEPEPHLRELARRAARQALVPVEVVDGLAERLPGEDGGFDAAVAALVLCSVADQHGALTEIARVLRPSGRLRFLEHVAAESAGLRRVQRAVDATVWPHFVGGCHTGRDTAAAITAAGFTIERLHHFRVPEGGVGFPTSPHIRGTALWNPKPNGEPATPSGYGT
ncbi:MAG TPA: methyltransferase domain-containing protein [Mycobacteriales bacterium]|nr:methyltransferase domain-containing protein [Mycobacteriales bacterium]